MLGLEIHGIYIEDVLDGFDPDESLVLSRYPQRVDLASHITRHSHAGNKKFNIPSE